MAKIKWGMVVADGRGKLGGQVFSKNRAGAYIRTKVTPTNPQTGAQTAVRQSFSQFSQNWSTLSQALILAWNAAVNDWATTDIFGDLKNPTGKNLYVRLNQSATLAGYPSFTEVPEKQEMVAGLVTSVTINVGLTELDIVGASSTAGSRTVVSATPALSGGTSYVKNRLRKIESYVSNASDPVASYNAYVAKFGVPVVGSNISFGISYVLANGQQSPRQIIRATVVA